MDKKKRMTVSAHFLKVKEEVNLAGCFLLDTHLPVVWGKSEVRMDSRKTNVTFYLWKCWLTLLLPVRSY